MHHREYDARRPGAVGFSLDEILGLERFLLLIPPIGLIYAAARIEALGDAGANIPPKVRQRLFSGAFGFVLHA